MDSPAQEGSWSATDTYTDIYPTDVGENERWDLAGALTSTGTEENDTTTVDSDYGGLAGIRTESPTNPRSAPKAEKAWKPSAWEAIVLDSVSAFAQSIVSGDIKTALQNAFRALVRGVIVAVTESVQKSMPGFGGALVGTLVGGLLGWLGNSLFKKKSRGPAEEQKPIIVEVANWPDALKHWVLPSSAYFQPTGLYNPRGIIQHNSNTINVSAGPKVASRVQRALTEQAFQDQLARGLV